MVVFDFWRWLLTEGRKEKIKKAWGKRAFQEEEAGKG